jgi:anti-sigma B factor antagonist
MTHPPGDTSDGEPPQGQPPEVTVVSPAEGVCVVRVECQLDMASAPGLRRVLDHELHSGYRGLVVDLSGCEYLGSAGLAALVAARDVATDTGTALALSGLGGPVALAFNATGLRPVFTVYPAEHDALAALTDEPASAGAVETDQVGEFE